MKYIELSAKDVENQVIDLHKKVCGEFKYDLVIFIAKGSYIIGKKMADLQQCPLLEISATRKGNRLKKSAGLLLKLMPKKMKVFLRDKEINSNIHGKSIERNIFFDKKIWKKYMESTNILLVDDSADTGYSIKLCKDEILSFFQKANVRVAVFNFFEKSSNIVSVDYYVYKDTMLSGPWSNDSKEHKHYINEYEEWHFNQ